MPSKILFLDDRWQTETWKTSFDKWLPESVTAIYESKGFKALERLRDNPDVKLVFLDMQFEGQPEQGEEILNKIKERYPDLKVIILTSLNDAQLALRLVHDEKKAYYFFFKDQLDSDQIKKTIENAIETYDLRVDAIRRTDVGTIIGDSPALKEVLRLVERVSATDSTILITGESGTGKELVARSIHLNSPRNRNSFVAVNCGAIPEDLIESELFGHVKGAFTSAVANKRGHFEMAQGGTIFLDEVAEMSTAMQVKLLRVLQDGEFKKVGGETSQRFDGRVIAATNKNLDEAVKNKSFREDLYYRLGVILIKLPPLRERKEDISSLVNYHLQRLNNKLGESKEITDKALTFLTNYEWPGNIRQLEHALERTILSSVSDTLDVDDFSSLVAPTGEYQSEKQLINKWVEEVINGEASWEDIRREFGAAGDARRYVIEGIIEKLKQQRGTRPTGADLAKLLKIKRNYVNQIMNSLGLQLKDT